MIFSYLRKVLWRKNDYLGKQGSWVRESPKKKKGKKERFLLCWLLKCSRWSINGFWKICFTLVSIILWWYIWFWVSNRGSSNCSMSSETQDSVQTTVHSVECSVGYRNWDSKVIFDFLISFGRVLAIKHRKYLINKWSLLL